MRTGVLANRYTADSTMPSFSPSRFTLRHQTRFAHRSHKLFQATLVWLAVSACPYIATPEAQHTGETAGWRDSTLAYCLGRLQACPFTTHLRTASVAVS